MEIVHGELKHLHAWGDLLRAFFKENIDEFGIGLDGENLDRTFFLWIRNPLTVNIGLEHEGRLVGCLVGLFSQLFYNTKYWYFYEHMWYVLPAYRKTSGGIRLLKEAERVCRERKVKHMVVGAIPTMMPEYLDKLYKRMGYRHLETHYIKEL